MERRREVGIASELGDTRCMEIHVHDILRCCWVLGAKSTRLIIIIVWTCGKGNYFRLQQRAFRETSGARAGDDAEVM